MPSPVAFDDFYWHDATLLGIRVDRRNPGLADVVALDIEWPDDRRETLQFTDCYGLDIDMNFGVVAVETILDAHVSDEDPGLIAIRSRWASMGMDLNYCRCYTIETNSTASKIRVFAKAFEVHPLEEA